MAALFGLATYRKRKIDKQYLRRSDFETPPKEKKKGVQESLLDDEN